MTTFRISFDLPHLRNELEELEQERASGRRKASIERDLSCLADFERRQADIEAMLDEADDPDLQAELTHDAQDDLTLSTEQLLSGEHDINSAFWHQPRGGRDRIRTCSCECSSVGPSNAG